MSANYPSPTPSTLKSWIVYLKGTPSETVKAYSIEYTRNHVVFKTMQGITYRAFRSEDVKEIELVS